MAKIISVYNGKNRFDYLLSGTLGDKVYFVRNGIQYTRNRPIHNIKPKSEAQLDQRARFNAVMNFLQPLTIFLRVGFKNDKISMSPFNAAMSYNFKNSIAGTYPSYEMDYSKVRVSQGSLPGALNPQVRLTFGGQIEYTWDDNSFEPDSRADDSVLLVVYNSSKQQAVFSVEGNPRYFGSQLIVLPETFEGDEVQCYIAFQNQRQTVFSNSQYIGSIVVS